MVVNPWRRRAAWIALAAPLLFLLFTALAISQFPNYHPAENWLSDLGAGPSAVFFTTGLMLAGLLMLPLGMAFWQIYQQKGARVGAVLFMLAGMFLIGVGVFPTGTPWHDPVSTLFFGSIALALIVLGAGTRSRAALIAGLVIPALGVLGVRPMTEHIAVAAIVLWALGYGAYQLRAKRIQ